MRPRRIKVIFIRDQCCEAGSNSVSVSFAGTGGSWGMAGTDKAENGLIWNGEQLDAQWVFLILQAKEAGLTVEEIQKFLTKGADDSTPGKGLLTGTND